MAVIAASVPVVAGPLAPAGATVPAGWVDQLVAGVGLPTAMASTPDRRLLVTTQPGTVRVIQSGSLLATPAIDLSTKICSNSERGLLGIAVDPQFTTNGFVFLYYSFKVSATCDSTTVNRVSRFVMAGDALGTETILVDNIPSPAGNHNAGDLQFGKDGFLYVSVGDGGCDYAGGGCGGANDASRDENVLVGKILRITRDGGIPPDNPFQGEGTAPCNQTGLTTPGLKCQETFARGLRNPFRMAFDPNSATTKFHINDVGQSAWEEIDLGAARADYGWNVREGHCLTGSTTSCGPPPAEMTNPIFDYGRSDGCVTIAGGAFVPNGIWPAAFDGQYLFADYGCGKIFRLEPNGGGGFTRTEFATGLGNLVHLAFVPYRNTQALYYTTFAMGGQIRRIVYPPGATEGDFDHDGSADRGVWRPSSGAWFIGGHPPEYLGLDGDVAVPADYDGDGDTDLAVFRPASGGWYVGGGSPTFFGLNGDVPVPADYDGDGDADRAVYRPGTGQWWIEGGGGPVDWGLPGDLPVPGDYDGDGDADIAVFRPASGAWLVRGSAGPAVFLGLSGDRPVPADYDGDGDVEPGVFRPATGGWHVSGAASPT
ncbi:MAG: PQQ-dependent sugar dehydrogenase, partial [Acidimicrobiales bacterium]